MSFNELVADVLTNYAVAWQGSDGAECFGIAMELFNLIEQHVEEAVARERQAIEKICEEFGAWNKTASEILDAIYDRSGKEPKP
jgi:hypothetical protein